MITDVLGRTVRLAGLPQRIVSLVPSLTEYLFAVGAGERVVGITDFCTEPAAQVAHLPRVRGTKNPDHERIIALRPDLVLASKEENRLRDVMALAAAGISVYVTDICTVADALEQLTRLAHILGVEADAAPLLQDMRAALDALPLSQANANQSGRRMLAFIWREPWMAVGEHTYANDLLRRCGAVNLALQMPGRYPRAALEAFMQLAPAIILLPDEPYRFTEDDLTAFAPFATVPAVQTGRIHLCNGRLLTWYGPQTSTALRVFRQFFAS